VGLNAEKTYSYKGRVITVLFVASILFFIRSMVKIQMGQVPHHIPLLGIFPVTIAWFLGREYDKYVYLSTKDPLTGLFNRRYVSEKSLKIIKFAQRKELNIGILLIDVNDFKDINDKYGHDYGDQILEKTAGLLVQSFDEKDIISRWGGDEFLIISKYSDENTIFKKINELETRLNKTEWQHKEGLSISIGTSSFPKDGQNLKVLVELADCKMYKRKVYYKKRTN